MFAVAFSPDAKIVATGGFDGHVRLIDEASGEVIKKLLPAPMDAEGGSGEAKGGRCRTP